jgi:hypothetical protein
MPAPPPRSNEQRKLDTLDKLRSSGADVWVATASVADEAVARAYLVPLSLAWTGESIVVALEPGSRTARNLEQFGQARLALGPTRDLVMIDAEVETMTDAAGVDSRIGDAYAAQTGWDPRRESTPFMFIVFRPVRIQAWREANEIQGRMLMKNGVWLA